MGFYLSFFTRRRNRSFACLSSEKSNYEITYEKRWTFLKKRGRFLEKRWTFSEKRWRFFELSPTFFLCFVHCFFSFYVLLLLVLRVVFFLFVRSFLLMYVLSMLPLLLLIFLLRDGIL